MEDSVDIQTLDDLFGELQKKVNLKTGESILMKEQIDNHQQKQDSL